MAILWLFVIFKSVEMIVTLGMFIFGTHICVSRVKFGNVIDGKRAHDMLGHSVVISSDGKTVDVVDNYRY